jgi:hypothetical protein
MEALWLIRLMSVHNRLSVAGRNETGETDETNETLFFYASACLRQAGAEQETGGWRELLAKELRFSDGAPWKYCGASLMP